MKPAFGAGARGPTTEEMVAASLLAAPSDRKALIEMLRSLEEATVADALEGRRWSAMPNPEDGRKALPGPAVPGHRAKPSRSAVAFLGVLPGAELLKLLQPGADLLDHGANVLCGGRRSYSSC